MQKLIAQALSLCYNSATDKCHENETSNYCGGIVINMKEGFFTVYEKGHDTVLFVEPEAYEGVRRIAERVAKDIELVTDYMPKTVNQTAQLGKAQVIIAATLGKSSLADKWAQDGSLDVSALRGKRESYMIGVVNQPFAKEPMAESALVILGSDKRGTIYGLFRLSEMCGVPSLVYWGDVKPLKKEEIILDIGKGIVSKEPSVEYRGFFINDEWPAFGNWCEEHFGGVNAKAYEEIFIFLLRMKGNYLWPAMWNSVFSEDGPGILNAQLADIYGVIIGLSHHEPMCRAGAEWQRIYSRYGEDNTWNFAVNGAAITEFWKDGILRNKPYENLITIGMRGENDSRLLSENATMADNIKVVKDAILAQHELLKQYINGDLTRIPRMLAIYKEVEDFYYGDDSCEGLKDWEELDDVIFMLCDDNFGNTRGLPSKDDSPHSGGYGMYYHFDYHGAPVSYEWQNSNRLTKTWEQMTMAYEHGIRKLWIVNVGDIKGVEYPLTFFMELAYDYEKWSLPNCVEDFVREWIDRQFCGISDVQKEQIFELLDGYTKWSAARRPEAMNAGIYHPWHYREADRVWTEVDGLMKLAKELHNTLRGDSLTAYESLIYYPAMATLNLILMNVEAGLNAHFARRGSVAANIYADSVKNRIKMDAEYINAYHGLLGGKWNHMMDSAHTGFRNWDDHDWCYPTVQQVIPIPRAKIVLGFRGSDRYHLGAHWQDGALECNEDFTVPNTEEVLIDLDSRGNMDFSFDVHSDKPWLRFSPQSGSVNAAGNGRQTVSVRCDRTALSGRENAVVEISVRFENGEKTTGRLEIAAGMEKMQTEYPRGTYIEQLGYIAMDAAGFMENCSIDGEGFKIIRHLGRMGDAVKAFPITKSFIGEEKIPSLKYAFAAADEGIYKIMLYLAPRNPGILGGHIRCGISVNDTDMQILETVSEKLYTEWSCKEWNNGVMNNIRVVEAALPVKKGLNYLYFYAGDPGIVLEKIVLHKSDVTFKESYLGPTESCRIDF